MFQLRFDLRVPPMATVTHADQYRTMLEMEQALFALRAWLVEEERAGRAMLVVPAGQPAIPGEVDPYAIDVPTHTEKEGSR